MEKEIITEYKKILNKSILEILKSADLFEMNLEVRNQLLADTFTEMIFRAIEESSAKIEASAKNNNEQLTPNGLRFEQFSEK